jgi:hypothetical protein
MQNTNMVYWKTKRKDDKLCTLGINAVFLPVYDFDHKCVGYTVHKILCVAACIKQIGSRGNAYDLHSEDGRFESRLGH